MIENEAETDDERNGPQPGVKGERRHGSHGAKGEECGVHRNARADQGFDVLALMLTTSLEQARIADKCLKAP